VASGGVAVVTPGRNGKRSFWTAAQIWTRVTNWSEVSVSVSPEDTIGSAFPVSVRVGTDESEEDESETRLATPRPARASSASSVVTASASRNLTFSP
jgi:hypothetical protein